MSALYLFNKEVQTLENYVNENTSLSVHVDTLSYPVKISFYEENRQMSMLEDNGSESDKAALLQFVFYDKMQIKTQEDFGLSEEVFNKLKSLSKEVNRLFLNAYFENLTKLKANIAEDFKKCKGVAQIGKTGVGADGNEYFLALVTPKEIVNSFIDYVEIEVK